MNLRNLKLGVLGVETNEIFFSSSPNNFYFTVPVPGKRQRKRPLVYAKRGSQGAGGVSKPFEYINKLTSILRSVRADLTKEIVPVAQRRMRPLVYTKRGPKGSGTVSKPFEYINKLASIHRYVSILIFRTKKNVLFFLPIVIYMCTYLNQICQPKKETNNNVMQ